MRVQHAGERLGSGDYNERLSSLLSAKGSSPAAPLAQTMICSLSYHCVNQTPSGETSSYRLAPQADDEVLRGAWTWADSPDL